MNTEDKIRRVRELMQFRAALCEVIDDAVEEAVREAEPTAEYFVKVW